MGGHFTGYQNDKAFGLVCYRDGARSFDVQMQEIGRRAWSGSKSSPDAIDWAAGARAATEFCHMKGFSGGFASGSGPPITSESYVRKSARDAPVGPKPSPGSNASQPAALASMKGVGLVDPRSRQLPSGGGDAGCGLADLPGLRDRSLLPACLFPWRSKLRRRRLLLRLHGFGLRRRRRRRDAGALWRRTIAASGSQAGSAPIRGRFGSIGLFRRRRRRSASVFRSPGWRAFEIAPTPPSTRSRNCMA